MVLVWKGRILRKEEESVLEEGKWGAKRGKLETPISRIFRPLWGKLGFFEMTPPYSSSFLLLPSWETETSPQPVPL